MKVTQFITAPNTVMKKNTIYPCPGEIGGAMVIKTSDEPLKDSFQGFGVAITGSSCYELNTMPKQLRADFLNDIYGKNGLNLSVGRLTVGSSDYSAELYSYDDVENDTELKHFSIERDMNYVLPMIKEIVGLKPGITLFASPWSPPGWMKTGGSMCGGYMREKYIECYARYIVKFINEYEKQGIKITAITPQNEPETAQNGRMPSCIWHPDIEAKYVTELNKQLKESKLDTKIWMYDHNFSGWKRVLWCFREYPELIEACSAAAFHYYEGCASMLKKLKEEYPDIKLHFTEGGPQLLNNYGTDWCKWGIMMSKALNNGCQTFTGWNLLLDENGGPNIGPFFCGGLATLNSQTGELTYSGQYHTFRHFSHFIQKGARIYPSDIEFCESSMFEFPGHDINVECCAAENPDGSFVLEITNPNSSKAQLQYYKNNQWWYIEALPDSVSTIIFE